MKLKHVGKQELIYLIGVAMFLISVKVLPSLVYDLRQSFVNDPNSNLVLFDLAFNLISGLLLAVLFSLKNIIGLIRGSGRRIIHRGYVIAAMVLVLAVVMDPLMMLDWFFAVCTVFWYSILHISQRQDSNTNDTGRDSEQAKKQKIWS